MRSAVSELRPKNLASDFVVFYEILILHENRLKCEETAEEENVRLDVLHRVVSQRLPKFGRSRDTADKPVTDFVVYIEIIISHENRWK